MRKSICALLVLLLFSACVGKKEHAVSSGKEPLTQPDSSMTLHYATGFKVDYFKDYKRVVLYDPWNKGEVLIRYYLTENMSSPIPIDGIRIKVPLHSLASGSCTHFTFMQQLNVLHYVTGICDASRTYNAYLRGRLKSGAVVDLGDPFKIDLERCLMLKPEVLMINSYNKQDENLERIKDAGIPVLYNNEWMETDLLGRAEWIRFIACFFNLEAQAAQIFEGVESSYKQIKQQVARSTVAQPSVLSGDDFRGSWYMPGGKSFTAQLFRDAGANYKYSKDTTTGSNPFTFEQVLHDFNQAEVWVGVTNASTKADLKQLDERYTLFRAFRNDQIWAYTLKTTPQGGNDFWETGVARPDWLLSDYAKIFHPDILTNVPFHFLRKIK